VFTGCRRALVVSGSSASAATRSGTFTVHHGSHRRHPHAGNGERQLPLTRQLRHSTAAKTEDYTVNITGGAVFDGIH
jgi:hypothetical protein